MKNKFLKKKNKFTKIIFIFVMLIIVFYACREELIYLEEKRHEADMIEHAKGWYESNKPETPKLLTSDETEQVPIKPEWTHVFETENENFVVVETDIMSKGRILYINEDCREKFEETKDPKYNQCYTRIVFRTDKKTGKTVGFLMTVVPDLEWLEKSHFKPFMAVTYLFRSEQFGGMILFHELDGRYANGWRYENGKVVAAIGSLNADPAEATLRSMICRYVTYYQEYRECTYYYSGNESGITNVDVVCRTGWGYPFTRYECYDDGKNNQGTYQSTSTGSTSSGGTSTPKSPTPRTDCPSSAATNNSTINNVLNTSYPNFGAINAVSTNIGWLRTQAPIMSYEVGLAVQYGDGNYWVYQGQGANNNLYVASGTLNGVSIVTNQYTYLVAHIHPKGTNSAPSPLDAIFLAQAYKGGSTNITANIEIAANGSEYMVYVNDRNTFSTFCNNSGNSQFFVPSGSMFSSGTTWANDYSSVYNNLVNQGFSGNDAQSYALSYVLDKYNTGLKIYEKKNGNFKEQKTEASGSNYSPKICQ